LENFTTSGSGFMPKSIRAPAVNPVTAWCQIFSDQPFYIISVIFYMISRTCSANLSGTSWRQLAPTARCFYHLDAGQLPHLDMILAMERVNGVQWVPGDGARVSIIGSIFIAGFSRGKKTQACGDWQMPRASARLSARRASGGFHTGHGPAGSPREDIAAGTRRLRLGD